MPRIHVKPHPGQLYRDPITREPIPEEGVEVEFTPYWRRAVLRGDVLSRAVEEGAPTGASDGESARRDAPEADAARRRPKSKS